MASLALAFDILARDQASPVFKKVGAEAEAAGKKGEGFGQSIGKSMKSALPSVTGFAGAIGTVGATLVGAGIAAGLGAVVSKSIDFEKAMSAAGAASTASAGQLGQLREAAIKAGADTQYSATQAAGAITEMAKAGVSTADILKGGLAGALDLAAAGQLDVGEAAGIAATAMTQFGLSGSQIPHVADLLAAGAGKAMGSVEDLAGALKYVGPVAAGMGVSIEETTGTLALFASQGILSEQAGTSLRGMLSSLTSPSKIAAEQMSELGINVFDAQGKFIGLAGVAKELHDSMGGLTEAERSEALGRIFGNEQLTAARILYKGGADAVTEWTKKVNDSGYAQEQAARLTDNLAGDLERLGGSFDTLLITIGQGSQGILRTMVQTLGALVDGVTAGIQAFSALPGPVKTLVVTLGALAVLKGPLSGVLDTLKGFGQGLGSSISGTFSAFGEALSYAKANGEGLGTVLRSVGSYAGSAVKGGLSSLVGFFGGPWGIAITGVTVGLQLLISWLGRTDEATQRTAQATTDYKSALEAAKGAINDTTREAAAKAAQDAGLLDVAEKLGIALPTVTSAITAQGTALDQIRGRLQAVIEAHTTASGRSAQFGASLDAQGKAAQDALNALNSLSGQTTTTAKDQEQLAEATGAAGDAAEATVAQSDAAAKALQRWRDQLASINDSFVDPLNTYKDLLAQKNQAEQEAAQKTADSTKSSKDSWKDYVGSVSVSLDELAAKLEEQIKAHENWRTNIVTISQRGGVQVGQIIAAMGEQGVDLAAKMATGTDAEFQRMADALIKDANLGGAGATAALDAHMKVMAAVGKSGGKATADQIAAQLNIGVADVLRIAAQYGINLARGINPLLGALGRPNVRLSGLQGFNTGGGFSGGGYTGDGGKYTPAGIVHGGEFVFTKEQTAKAGVGALEVWAKMLSGYAGGGFVATSQVPRPSSTSPYRIPISTAGDSAMGKEYAETVAFVAAQAAARAAAAAAASSRAVFSGAIPTATGTNQQIVQSLAASMYGWIGPQWAALYRLVMSESGFRNTAQNPTSTAYGMFQFLNSTWAGYGVGKTSDPRLQTVAGLRYIASKYGTPANAWAFHLAHNWYDDGGFIPPGVSLAINGTGKPERVLGPNDGGGQLTGNLYLTSGEFLGVVRGVIHEDKRQDAIADRRRYGR